MTSRPNPAPTGPGEESVWNYPRPPRLERTFRELEVWLGGRRIAWSNNAMRVLETSHPPVYYFPIHDVDWSVLRWSAIEPTQCEFKGTAWYLDIIVPTPAGDVTAAAAAFTYTEPNPDFAPIREWVSYYAGPMDRCLVDGELVTPQPGAFYSGWITRDVKGPFKGDVGTHDW